MNKECDKNKRLPKLFRGDYSDEQLIEWLDKLIIALQRPAELEKTAEMYQQSLNDVSEQIVNLRELQQQSICSEVQDPTRHHGMGQD